MHPQARNAIIGFLKQVDTTAKRVLEVGSYDVNGTVRDLFAQAATYHGIDIRPAPALMKFLILPSNHTPISLILSYQPKPSNMHQNPKH